MYERTPRAAAGLAWMLALAAPGLGLAQGGGETGDYGDAPGGAPPYPNITGECQAQVGFPTCIAPHAAGCAPGTFVLHRFDNVLFLGPAEDVENDGNGGFCAVVVILPIYNIDECQADGDAGLVSPSAFSFQPGVARCAPWVVVPCTNGQAPLGRACGQASITVTTTVPPGGTGFLNVLVDWNQDGDWCDVANCAAGPVPEHWVQNLIVAGGNVVTPPLPIGPQPGYAWMRVSLTPVLVPVPWEGSGIFQTGETEDYVVYVDATTPVQPGTWGGVKSHYR